MSIFEYIVAARSTYRTQLVEITPGLEFSQYETIRRIELYHNSAFESGPKDSLGREKPFYNITKFRVNVAVRATDLDTKDVQIQSDDGDYAQSFLLTLKNRNWMKDQRFAQFLNKAGHTRAKYGGLLVKKIERDDSMELIVVPWRDSVTDQTDIRSGVKIERHFYTPAQLGDMTKSGWKNIDTAIETAKKVRTADTSEAGKPNKTLGAFVEVWECHGVLPTSYLAGTSDAYPQSYGSDDEYSRQMHIVVLDESKGDKTSTDISGVTLYAGPESEDPYKYLPWDEVDGRGLGVGVIEDLFEAQVWTNYSVAQIKDALDLAGKTIFQTANMNIAAKNILTDIHNGQIITSPQPVTQVNNTPTSLPAFEQLIEQWDKQAENVTSTYDAVIGQTLPAGTPFQLGGMLNQAGGGMFEYRREEFGLFIQEIYTDWVLPFLVKQIKNQKELVSDLTTDELEMVAGALAEFESRAFIKKQVLSGKLVYPQDIEHVRQTVKTVTTKGPKRRKFTIPDGTFDEAHLNVDVITTGEQKNTAVRMQTLFNLLQVVAQNPALLNDPVLARLFNQIVEAAGVSPMLLQSSSQPTAQPTQPAALPAPAPAQSTPSPLQALGANTGAAV